MATLKGYSRDSNSTFFRGNKKSVGGYNSTCAVFFPYLVHWEVLGSGHLVDSTLLLVISLVVKAQASPGQVKVPQLTIGSGYCSRVFHKQ